MYGICNERISGSAKRFSGGTQEENAEYYEEICDEMSKIVQAGDLSNGSVSLNAAAQIYGGFIT